MVGEIRDRETADMAIQAALTGHLVLSTLHTNDAPTAVTRLLDLGVPPYLINSTLLGVMAQRLVRTLCPHCKQAGEPPDDDDVATMTSPWRGREARAGHGAGGLPRVPDDGLPRPDRAVRDHADDAGAAPADHARRRRSRDARAGVSGRHEAAARLRRDEDRGGH